MRVPPHHIEAVSWLTVPYVWTGVTFHLVSSGMNDRDFERGLSEWRKRHPAEVVEDAAGEAPEGDA